MTLDTDFHSHVVRSSALQMAQSARERGLRILGLSEHVFQMSEARAPLEHMPPEGPMLTIPQYIAEVRAAAIDTPLDVRLGLEVDFVPGKNELIQAPLHSYDWDFLIGSIHEIDGQQFEQVTPTSREEGEALWLHYYQLLTAVVRSGFFSLVSHPVRMRTTNPYVPSTLDQEFEHLAAEATRQNIALEINGYDVLRYPDIVRRLARACLLHKTPISVGSDAHNPRQVAQAHTQTTALLREVGITNIRIWKQRVPEEYAF
jgi:histidinol-phosphatase (PHP family)